MTPSNEIHIQRTFTSQVHARAGRTQFDQPERFKLGRSLRELTRIHRPVIMVVMPLTIRHV